MSTKYVPPPMKSGIPKMPIPTVPTVNQETLLKSTRGGSTVTKFLPFLCAGAAVGVSILALKELKKIKAEMVLVKNQQNNVQVVKQTTDPALSKKLENLEEQLKRVNLYLVNKNSPRNDSKIIKNVLKTEIPKEVKIINEEPVFVPANNEEIEYEEVEVTDDEDPEEEEEQT